MVAFSVILAYILTILIPALIIGFGAMCGDVKTGSLLGLISFISFMSFYIYKGLMPVWILTLMIIVLGLFFVILYRNLFGGGDSE